MQEPLRESKYENAVDVTSFCTEILAGDQSSSFEGLGKNSQIRPARGREWYASSVRGQLLAQ
jgi:uncharacterized protein with gpF-like domain